MERYRMDDGTILNTANARQWWKEETDWDGRNHISRATGSQWEHQTLYQSRKGRYYLVHRSQWQGSRDYAEWISPEAATQWLLLMEHTIPDDLTAYVDDVSE